MAALYELDARLMSYEYKFDEETGEWLNEDELNEIEMDRNDKIENIALWIKNLEAEANSIADEMKALKARKESKERLAKNLRGNIQHSLAGEKFETSKVAISYRRSTQVEVTDIGLLDADYLRTKTTVEPDKVAIKEALKNGEEVEGAKLVENVSMQLK